MGQIRGKKAHISACNIRSLSSFGIPYAGMHILVSTDNSATEDGQGNFDAYVVGDGTTPATALPLIEITPIKALQDIVGSGVSGSEEEEKVVLLKYKAGYINTDGKSVTAQSQVDSILLYDITGAKRIEFAQGSHNYDRFYLLDGSQEKLLSKTSTNTSFSIDLSEYPTAKYISACTHSGGLEKHSIFLYYGGSDLSSQVTKNTSDISDLNGEIFDSVMEDLEYDTTEIVAGFLSYGTVQGTSGYITPFIDVTGIETIYITGRNINNGLAYAAVTGYDENQEILYPLVDGVKTNYSNKEVSIPANVKYIRVHSMNTPPVVKKKTKTSAISQFGTGIEEVNERVDNLIPYTFYPKDLPFTIEKEGYRFVNASETAAAAYCITNYIEVTAGKKLHICTGFTSNSSYRTGVWYDADKQVITYVDMTDARAWNDTEVTVPENAKYIRLATNNRYGLRLYYIGDTTPAEELMESQYHKMSLEINNGVYASDGSVNYGTDSRYKRTEFNIVKGRKYKIRCYNAASLNSVNAFILYNSSSEEYTVCGTNGVPAVEYFTAPFDGKVMLSGSNGNNTPRTSFDVWEYGGSSSSSNKAFNKTIHTIGHSFWNGDGLSYTQFGVTKTRKGYQSIFKNVYEFNSFDDLRYDGHSLGAQSASDTSSIALKLSSWTGTTGDIWCMDSITNDFKRNIPLGTLADNYNAAEPDALTYYGALRLFRNKIVEVSGSDAIVVVSNATHRNNSGYTSTSTNSAGCKLSDYSNALMCIAELEGWFFVDVFNFGGITDDNLAYTTIDGLHPNNLGYKLSVKPWIAQLDIIKEMYG